MLSEYLLYVLGHGLSFQDGSGLDLSPELFIGVFELLGLWVYLILIHNTSIAGITSLVKTPRRGGLNLFSRGRS